MWAELTLRQTFFMANVAGKVTAHRTDDNVHYWREFRLIVEDDDSTSWR